MGLKIEKNIPLPVIGESVSQKYPFHEMEVGDSILLPADRKHAPHYARAWFQRHGKKMIGRTVDGGTRIWRVA